MPFRANFELIQMGATKPLHALHPKDIAATRVRYGERVHCPRRVMYKVAVMQDRVGVGQKDLDDAELIALVRETQEGIEVHGEVNQLNLLLHDFARELLKRRMLPIVEFVRLIVLTWPE